MYLRSRSTLAAALLCAISSLAVSGTAAAANFADHYEFEAALAAPYTARADHTREFGLQFRFDGADDGTQVAWRLDIVNDDGLVLRSFRGETQLVNGRAEARARWNERDGKNGPLPWGHYTARLSAVPLDFAAQDVLGLLPQKQRIDSALQALATEGEAQEFQVEVGSPPRPAMPEFARLRTSTDTRTHGSGTQPASSAPATGGLPYTVYFGNLHSQTNHSDGGGVLSSCTGAQNPQSGAYGPADAYAYAQGKGLDILMASEHNHMFDGSDSTNTSANPSTAKNLYQSGLSAASNYSAAHPGFLALYGMEWGVISNGGHLNIFGSNELYEWEYNSSNQLIGDVLTPKSDYAALYTTMKNKGVVGQFNHPASSGQFLVGSTAIGYSADGDAVMVLAEISNTSAFSTITNESQGSASSYESAYKIMLERGYHVAPSTDQDNHCAQWGASWTNRTAVLIPNGTALSNASFTAALKARRVFATHDKTAQLILTANSHIMGERFANSGALTLTANYAPGNGRSASTVAIFEGVPGRNGTVTQLASTATTTITPANGEHYYYAKITQDNGTILWSAPVWVSQGASGDSTPPTVSASESGTSGTITLSATASDNIGVTAVEFYVDGTLKGNDTTSPYSMTLNSTTLTNGSHSLTAKAYDAAGNSTTSSTVSFSVSNATSDTTPPTVSASESGTSGTITLSATASDNVGVSSVEFYVDGTLKGSDASSPYSMTLDSTTLANGSHALTAKAYDAAGNSATSSAANFSVSNTTGTSFNEAESNGSVAAANTVAHSYTAIVGTMGNTTDKDYFALSLAANEKLTINMTGPAANDYDLYLVDSADATLTSSAGGTSTEAITYTNGAAAKTVYAKVISYSGSSTTLTYNLALSYTAGTTTATDLTSNGGFESGATVWTASSGVIDSSATQAARTGSWKAWMNGYGSAHTDTLQQNVTIPSTATSVTFSFWLKVVSDETTTTTAFDTVKAQVRNTSGTVLATLGTWSNLDKGSSYVQKSFDLTSYKGQTVQIYFVGVEGSTTATSFLIDDVSVKSQ
jgi:hypothetical protein